MATRKKVWMPRPPKVQKPKAPENLKTEVAAKANEFVENILKPRSVKPSPDNINQNYVVDIYTKWHHHYFFFVAKYASPGPNAISPFFEESFARMEYTGIDDRFNLSFKRYTGQWVEIYYDLSADACLVAIRDDPWFMI